MEFRQFNGALGAGDDIVEPEAGHTLESAMTRCAELGAAGFTYNGGVVPKGTGLAYVWFKTRVNTNDDAQWTSFINLITPGFETLNADYQYVQGAIAANGDVGHASDEPLRMTLQQAMRHANADPRINGFTFNETQAGGRSADTSIVVWFKSKGHNAADRVSATPEDREWGTYLKRKLEDFESLGADFKYAQGAIAQHGDVGHGDTDPLWMTMHQAMRHANTDPRIKGFTFNETQAGGRGANVLTAVWFKSKGHNAADRVSATPEDREWGMYLKQPRARAARAAIPEGHFETLNADYQYVQGAIAANGDVGHASDEPLRMTLQQAMRHANADPRINGFTFNETQAGGRSADTSIVVWFKSKGHNAADRVSATPEDREWGTYLKQPRARAAIPESLPPVRMPPIPRSAVSGRTLANSNFKVAYEKAVAPNTMMKLGVKLGDVIQYFCSQNKLSFDDAEGERFFEELQADMTEEDSIEQAVQRMWTSYRVLGGKEICFMLNDITRDDPEDAVRPAAALTRAINKSCVTAGASRAAAVHPPGNVCYRGGGFDDRYRDFFAAGREFRQPAFLATSFSEETAQKFIRMRGGSDCVMWVVRIDPDRKCRHVNLVTRHVPGLADEQEYLFAPYSAFTVLTANWNTGSADNPHVVELLAAVDNKEASEDLPLAPWS